MIADMEREQEPAPQGLFAELEAHFAGLEASRMLFDVLRREIEVLGPVELRVTKSQVAFQRSGRPFAWAWAPRRYPRGNLAPLVLTVALRRRDPSDRWKEVVEARLGRFTHHLELSDPDQLDDQVRSCLREAWDGEAPSPAPPERSARSDLAPVPAAVAEAGPAAAFRQCAGPQDFATISDFLAGLYVPGNRDGNWLQPIWEYAYTHPWFDESSVGRIGIWEADGRIVALAGYESRLGEAFFQFATGYRHLRHALLDHAEAHLALQDEDGSSVLSIFLNDWDAEFARLALQRGFARDPGADRPMTMIEIPLPFPPVTVRDGFRLVSLADENDLVRWDRVLWRGFNHPGEPPVDGPHDRLRMQFGPHYRKDLAIAVEAPGGDFAAFAGLWFEPVNRIAYVEPVATDPDYRRMGLGTAAVLEGIRRCGELGATVAYVGSTQPFYLAMGFREVARQECWVKRWRAEQPMGRWTAGP